MKGGLKKMNPFFMPSFFKGGLGRIFTNTSSPFFRKGGRFLKPWDRKKSFPVDILKLLTSKLQGANA
jgi:hypothetical protein